MSYTCINLYLSFEECLFIFHICIVLLLLLKISFSKSGIDTDGYIIVFQVSIQGKNGYGGPRGDIAIDNIYVEHDKCKAGKTTTCDFESHCKLLLTILTKDINCQFARRHEHDEANTSEYIDILQCSPYIVCHGRILSSIRVFFFFFF